MTNRSPKPPKEPTAEAEVCRIQVGDDPTPDQIKQRIGRNIKGFLLARGWAQKDLEGGVGLDKSAVSELIHGKFNKIPEALRRVASKLGVTVEAITGGIPTNDLNQDALLERQAAFKAAGHNRSDPAIYDFLDDEVMRLGTPFSSVGSATRMEWRDLRRVRLPIPVSVLCRTPLLGPQPTDPIKTVPVIESNPYVLLRDSMMGANQKLIGKPENDNITYTLNAALAPGNCVVRCGLTRYVSAIATHDVLEQELLEAAGLARGSAVGSTISAFLKERAIFRAQPAETQRRYAALAISTALIYKTAADGWKVMFRKRGGTAVHSDLYHVIPACMFRADIDVAAEFDIRYRVITEYSAELFSEEMDRRREDPTYIYREWAPAAALSAALGTGQCELIVSGLIVNLLNLRPEICCVLFVHDPEWYHREVQQKAKPNWEYVPRTQMVDRMGAAISDFHLDDIEDEFVRLGAGAGGLDAGAALTGQWVPPGLAALWLGVDVARQRQT